MTINSKKILTFLMVCLCPCILFFACNRESHSKDNRSSSLHITSEVIQVRGGWGYKINVNNHPFIYQNQIPCISGDKPFPTKESALAVSNLVVNKIAHGQLPTITLAELERITNIKDN